MNTINTKIEGDQIIYTLRGPLNSTLKSKLKNNASKILNNSDIKRNLTQLFVSKEDSEELNQLIKCVKSVKEDLKLPAIQFSIFFNKLNINILTNSKKGTYIKSINKNKYFENIGKQTVGISKKSGYFLRKGAGSILLNKIINKMKHKGIKTILVHPLTKELEKYYSKFGFISIPKVPLEIGEKYYFETIGGHLMYLEL